MTELLPIMSCGGKIVYRNIFLFHFCSFTIVYSKPNSFNMQPNTIFKRANNTLLANYLEKIEYLELHNLINYFDFDQKLF